jgi:hypothetical protein
MHRNSAETRRLVARMRKSGVQDIDGRRLERFDHDHMLWLEGTPLSRQAEHVRQLVKLTGRGKDNDRAARIMLTRGFPCERARDAVARAVGIPCAKDITFDEAIDDTTDDGFALIETEANEIESAIRSGMNPGPPRVMQQFARAVLERAVTGADNVRDRATNIPATPEQVVHSLTTNALSVAIGSAPYDLTWIFALAGVEPSAADINEISQLHELICGGLANRALLALAHAPVGFLSVMALVSRNIICQFGEAMELRCLKNDEDLDELAATFAPMIVGFVLGIRSDARQSVIADMEQMASLEQAKQPDLGPLLTAMSGVD